MLDKDEVDAALVLDAAWAEALREAWTALMRLAMFGDLRSAQMGAATRLRKKLLDAGERVRALLAPRDWIPHPRERLKNALAGYHNLQESLQQVHQALAAIDGGRDRDALRAACDALQAALATAQPQATRWAALLDSQRAADAADED